MEQRLSSRGGAGPRPPLSGFMLGAEAILVLALWGILGIVSGRIPDERGDYGFMFVFVLVVQSIATLRFFTRAGHFASLRCEACSESYHGGVLGWFRSSSRGCASCGAHFDEPQQRGSDGRLHGHRSSRQ